MILRYNNNHEVDTVLTTFISNSRFEFIWILNFLRFTEHFRIQESLFNYTWNERNNSKICFLAYLLENKCIAAKIWIAFEWSPHFFFIRLAILRFINIIRCSICFYLDSCHQCLNIKQLLYAQEYKTCKMARKCQPKINVFILDLINGPMSVVA